MTTQGWMLGPSLNQKPAYAIGIWCGQLPVIENMLQYIMANGMFVAQQQERTQPGVCRMMLEVLVQESKSHNAVLLHYTEALT